MGFRISGYFWAWVAWEKVKVSLRLRFAEFGKEGFWGCGDSFGSFRK